ncbi:MAG: helix-turn-helix transcriptional regulator [Deltaproteobacteria bacterium]|nr:helix-turn-helix transcriptional regulator [Deltaproteobacteria bacterium]
MPGKRAVPAGLVPDREQTIGAFVRARRRANRLTQAQLGELAGVGRRLVVELERDKPTLRMDAANSVLAVFGKVLGVVDAHRPEIDE